MWATPYLLNVGLERYNLLHCEIATKLWSALLQLFGVAWTIPQKVSDSLTSWREQLGNHDALNIWRPAPLRLMW